ncbi:MAG: retron system putative HNH endonuclease [Alteromonas sp.]|uniref:retron system putative HNH endonuclease n=1 Tax=Alteromonas sp. TaxID=232 RepID=UPI0032D9265D
MRRIAKSPSNILSNYCLKNPVSNWNEFRNFDLGVEYKKLKETLYRDQSGLCAYCEAKIPEDEPNLQRVEHFNSKHAHTPANNYCFDWQNILLVCLGGEDFEEQKKYPLPSYLSCDAHKAYLEGKHARYTGDWNGLIYSPLALSQHCELISFCKASGKLIPDQNACSAVSLSPNSYGSTLELVDETLRILNLNCSRLCDSRLKVFRLYERYKKACRVGKPRQYLQLVEAWSSGSPGQFQTTRDLLISSDSRLIKNLEAKQSN